MKYMIAVESPQYIEVEAETAEAAIQVVRSQLDRRVAAASAFQVVQELTYDEESGSYKML